MCIFCDIASGKVPTEIIYQDDLVAAFADINPLVPTHILIVPKEHIASVNDLPETDEGEKLAGRLLVVAKKLAKEQGIAEGGYKLLLRTGSHGGQEVPHIHLHLLGGGKMKEGIGLAN